MSDKDELLSINNSLNAHFAQLNVIIINDEQFNTWPGAVRHHHAYEGGLIRHTLEVVRFCDFTASQNPKINRDILLSGAIWHDFGKVWDYEPVVNASGEIEEWRNTRHKNRIYHICKSYHEYLKYAEDSDCISDDDIEHVSHLILSHHNLPEYDSPRRPQTLEAWALHLADMNSAFCGGSIGSLGNPRIEKEDV